MWQLIQPSSQIEVTLLYDIFSFRTTSQDLTQDWHDPPIDDIVNKLNRVPVGNAGNGNINASDFSPSRDIQDIYVGGSDQDTLDLVL